MNRNPAPLRRSAAITILAAIAAAGPAAAQAPPTVGRWRSYRKDPGYNEIGMWAAHGVYSRRHLGDTVYVL